MLLIGAPYWIMFKSFSRRIRVVLITLNRAISLFLSHDDGYPQHQKMCEIVKQTWLEMGDIKKVFTVALEMWFLL